MNVILAGNMEFDNRLLHFASRLADEAGSIAKRYWRAPFSVEQKQDASPVTIADKEIEAKLRVMIAAEFPAHGIIGEEQEALNPGADHQWVIDPIDGTRAFIAGYPTFTTLISLCHKGAPQLGVIDQPVMGERWVGIAGRPTLYNGTAVITKKTTQLKDALIATTSAPYHFNEQERDLFEKLRKQCAQTAIGGDGYGYAMLASGHIDLFVDAGLKPYDFCALAPVIEGAGGIISDWNGNPLTLHSDGKILAAANAELHGLALMSLRA